MPDRNICGQRSRTVCTGCAGIGLTSTSCIGSTPARRLKIASECSVTFNEKAGFVTSESPMFPLPSSSEHRRWTVASVQNRYNLLEREGEDVLQYCSAHGIPFIPWFPLQRGRLGSDPSLSKIAIRRGVTPHQVALAWLLQKSPVVLPIPGTLSEQHLKENLAATDLRLDPDEIRSLDAMVNHGVNAPP